ncbi:MAG: hypothetical protein K2W95_10565 [Candidatus Obscuribacterales bacterium]|nr:hypothetical protein [Candidatus Obscuribacterales bacterium]
MTSLNRFCGSLLIMLLSAGSVEAAEFLRGGASLGHGLAGHSTKVKSHLRLHNATVGLVNGEVTCCTPGSVESVTLRTGDPVPAGSAISTGPRSHCVVRWQGAGTTMYSNTCVMINADTHDLSVKRGDISLGLNKFNDEIYRVSTAKHSALVGGRGCLHALAMPDFERIDIDGVEAK